MTSKKISRAVLERLPRYYRYARDLFGSDTLRISSSELASMMGLSPSQVRQDLSSVGQFGSGGYGYNTRDLYEGLEYAIGLSEGFKVVVVGMNEIGFAVANSDLLKNKGIIQLGYFDYSENVGKICRNKKIMSIVELEPFCKDNSVDVAVVCVDTTLALEACSLAISGGVKGIWNLSGAELRPERLKKKVSIVSLNPFDSLAGLLAAINMTEKNDDSTKI